MEALIFRCGPQHFFRLGRSSLENTYDIIHSDTLFSALVNTYALAYGQAETHALLEDFRAGKLRISSAFHCIRPADGAAGEPLYFLPLPLSLRLGQTENLKRLKRLRYLSAGLWESPGELAAQLRAGMPLALGGTHALKPAEAQGLGFGGLAHLLAESPPVRQEQYPHVRVHQRHDEDRYYTSVSLQPQELSPPRGPARQTHFYCLLDTEYAPEAPARRRLMAAFRLLADEGIGGDRSSGGGLFDGVEIRPWVLATEAGGTFVSLSMTLPASESEFRCFRYYQLDTRGGGEVGRYAAQTRKRVRMIAEGALHSGGVRGSIADLSLPGADTPTLRNGLTLSLPFPYEHP